MVCLYMNAAPRCIMLLYVWNHLCIERSDYFLFLALGSLVLKVCLIKSNQIKSKSNQIKSLFKNNGILFTQSNKAFIWLKE